MNCLYLVLFSFAVCVFLVDLLCVYYQVAVCVIGIVEYLHFGLLEFVSLLGYLLVWFGLFLLVLCVDFVLALICGFACFNCCDLLNLVFVV